MHKLTWIIIGLLTLSLVSAGTLNNFSDGSTSGNFTYTTGGEWYTKSLNIPSGASVNNAYLYLKGYNISSELWNTTSTVSTITNFPIATTPSWTVSAFTCANNANAYDGNFATAVVCPNTNTSGSHNAYYIGLYNKPTNSYKSINNVNTTSNVSIREVTFSVYAYQVNSGIYLICWVDGSTTTNVFTSPYITIAARQNFTVPTACFNNTRTDVKIQIGASDGSNIFNFYDIELNISYTNTTTINNPANVTYPTNVTLILNNQSVVFNYGSSNASNLDHNITANITSFVSNLVGFPQNISFRSNTSGILEFSGVFASYSVLSNITIFTELNKTAYKGSNMSVNVISGNGVTTNYWTTNASVLFANPAVTGISRIEFFDSSTMIVPRRFYFNNLETASQNISLYVINSTNVSQVLFTLYSADGATLPGYYVGIYRKWLPDNSFYLVEMHKTDDNSQALLNVKLYDQLYKIRVYDTGMNQLYETGETEIKSTAISLTVNLEEDNWESLENIRGVSVTPISFHTASSQFRTGYIDSVGILNYTTFTVTRRTLLGDVTVCNNITYTSSANLYCTVDLEQPGTYIASLTAETRTNFSHYPLDSYWYKKVNVAMGKSGVFMTIIMILALVSFGLYNPAVAIILAIVGFGISAALGLVYVSAGAVIVVAILGGMILFKMRT